MSQNLLMLTLSFLIPGASAIASPLQSEAVHHQEEKYLAGFGRMDISPSFDEIQAGEIHLGGFGLGTKAEGIADPIFARTAILAELDRSQIMVVSILDLPGLGNRSIHAIQRMAAQQTGIPLESIHVGVTHTHAGPDLQGLWGGVSDGFRLSMEVRAAQSIVDAFQALRPAYVSVSGGNGYSKNRRGWDFTDTSITSLEAVAADSGEHLGVLVNFASHPIILGSRNKLVSSDYCGYLVSRIEAERGGIAVYANGVQGDVVPDHAPGDVAVIEGIEEARLYGELIAGSALTALESHQERIYPAKILQQEVRWEQPLSNLIFQTAWYAGKLKNYEVENHGFLDLKVKTQATYFRLGDNVQGIVFPGEALSREGIPMKQEMKAEYRLFFGLTGDTLGYFVPSDEWHSGRNNHYEELISPNPGAGDHARELITPLISADNPNFNTLGFDENPRGCASRCPRADGH